MVSSLNDSRGRFSSNCVPMNASPTKPIVATTPCLCESGKPYARCCGPYLDTDASAPTAEALMRSRYTAYALGREAYILATWNPSTRPRDLALAADQKWLGLSVKTASVDPLSPDRATVEFVARYRIDGRGHRMHERSSFVREGRRWFYVDGEQLEP